MISISRYQELGYTCTGLLSTVSSAEYPSAAAIKNGEIMEAATFEGLIAALDNTQPEGTECVLSVAENGKRKEKDDYTTKERED